MNTAQRKFLIERIQKKVTERIDVLKNDKLKYPSASNYIFKAILNSELKLQSNHFILEALKNKALNAKEGENWLSNMRMGFEKETEVHLRIKDLIILPDDYHKELTKVSEHNKKMDAEIAELLMQKETIEVRIQLASDKTLQKLINEVDDMGDLSLVDTKLKLLS